MFEFSFTRGDLSCVLVWFVLYLGLFVLVVFDLGVMYVAGFSLLALCSSVFILLFDFAFCFALLLWFYRYVC